MPRRRCSTVKHYVCDPTTPRPTPTWALPWLTRESTPRPRRNTPAGGTLRPGAREAYRKPWHGPGVAEEASRRLARFFAEAVAAEPKLADDPSTSYRYDAACAAALAGCGRGEDAARLADGERARLACRPWAGCGPTWRPGVRSWRTTPDQACSLVQEKLRKWEQDPDLTEVSGAALAKLPEAERQAWQQLWKDVEQMLKRVSH